MTIFKKYAGILFAGLFLCIASCSGPQKPSNDADGTFVSSIVHTEWSKNANLYEVNIRQFTPEGTINAFAKHLPRLKEMGVDILWFMPVTPIGEINRKGTYGSYYSVKDYTAINPEYGTMDDFKKMVDQIHELGMHIIIDWVANHTAWDNSWTQTNPEFYYKDSLGNFTPPHNTDWTDVIQLDYDNRGLWSAMIEEMSFWVRDMNIDGFRCDVAYLVPTEFWNQARRTLDSIKPVFMLAEADHPELKEHAFNAGYSWVSHHAMNRIARRDDDVSALDRYFFEENRGNYPKGAYKINFITNHDENSWAGSEFERMGDGMEAFAVLVNTVPGMPLMYNGQEAGLSKRLDFFEKDEIDWSDLKYEEFYKTLLEMKHKNQALWNGQAGGSFERVLTNDDLNVFAFLREKDKNKVFVVLNLSPDKRTITFGPEKNHRNSYNELFSGKRVKVGKNFSLELEPWGYKVYIR
jgi:cyclomaltodextrinase / maltogenic alpha-amylase / neopullulanase